MLETFLKIYRGYGKVLWGFAVVSGLFTFAIMWVIDANALSRKAFNLPVPAAVEITQSLLTAAIMLPFGYALLKREHVRTVLFTSRLSRPTTRLLHVFWMITGFVLFALVSYGTFRYALRSYNMNEQVWGATIRFPLWPAKMAVSLGTLLLSVQFLLDAVRGLLTDDDGELHETIAEEVEKHPHA